MNKLKNIINELFKVVVLEISLLVMSYVLFVFGWLCATDPQLFDSTQKSICSIIGPTGTAIVFASPVFAILIYFIQRKMRKNSWKQIGFTFSALLVVSVLFFLLRISIF